MSCSPDSRTCEVSCEDPAGWPESVLLTHGEEGSDRKSNDFGADFDRVLQLVSGMKADRVKPAECYCALNKGVGEYGKDFLVDT